ncbi:MAG: AAA family ATPase [Anaerolineae bacterium]|nr:AAA family ATPase [Anaerolineae bacterium]
MRLERVTLQNFRQYYGKQPLEFAKDSHKNVTVIHGINGAGKTSFFLALNWCLYGKNVDDIRVIDNVGELMSKEAVHQALPGTTIRTSVDLTFLHNGERYLVRRSLIGVKQSDGLVELSDTDEFVVMITGADGQAKRINNPIGMMNSILPVNVREYFLFDGEKIDNFAKPEAAEQVKQAIYLVLNIEILERAQRHLDHNAREYRKQLKQVSGGELRDLIEQDENHRAVRENANERKYELTREIDSANKKIAEIDDRLRNIQNAKTLQQRRDTLEKDIKLRRVDLNDIINKIALAATSSHAAVAAPAIHRALDILEEKRQRGEIPSGIRQQFVQDLIDQMICICGRPFTDGSPEHQRLLSLLESRLPGSIEDDILNTNAVLRTFVSGINEKLTQIDGDMGRRTELVDLIKAAEAELDDVSRQLEGSPLEEISRLEKRRQDFVRDINNYSFEIGSLSNEIEGHNTELKRLEKAIAKAQKEKKEQLLLAMKVDLAQKAVDAIQEMHQAFADDMRQRIEVKTKEIFKQLVWKDSHFQDVQLGSDFNLEVIDRYGRPARPELSAGERQVLSLSFIAAMSQISEEEAPLVMDTPFGRLSSHHRNSITERLPVLADQLILFVTDEELHGQALDNLKPFIGTEYRLNFDRQTSCTTIEKMPL